jgi:CRP-like cAMP-binding protein
MSWLVDVVPAIERARVEANLASCSLLSLPRGSSLGADRFETVPLVSIEDGIVFVSVANGSARRIVVGLAGPGSIVVAPAARERLEALTDARLMLIAANTRARLLECTALATIIVEAVGGGVRDCRDDLAQFGCRPHTERLRLKIIQLARTYGKVGTDGLVLDLPLTHELLADMVGSTRETVTRSLTQLALEGVVRHERGRYLVAAPPRANGLKSSPPRARI